MDHRIHIVELEQVAIAFLLGGEDIQHLSLTASHLGIEVLPFTVELADEADLGPEEVDEAVAPAC